MSPSPSPLFRPSSFLVPLFSTIEIHRDRVPAAHDDGHVLAGVRPVAAARERRERGRAAGLGDDASDGRNAELLHLEHGSDLDRYVERE